MVVLLMPASGMDRESVGSDSRGIPNIVRSVGGSMNPMAPVSP